ncbi:MAG: autotransporter domain-containing protein [Gallionellaceae bacterium]|nr:autotransporter domain-containing protein [Gallionellaceae bacterium]
MTAAGLTLSVNGSGLVTGTLPTVTSPTNYSVTLSAANAIGTGSQTFTLTVNPPAPVVTNPGTMSATSGSAFSYQIIATNSPTSYSVTAAGLTLSVNGSGLVTGTLPAVTSATNYSITLDASSVTGTGSQTFTLTVNPPTPVVSNPGTLTTSSGAAFNYQIVATNSPTSYGVTAAGLTLSVNGSGLVTGTVPTVTSPTNYSVTLDASNSAGTGSRTFTLTVNPPSPAITNPGTLTATSGAAFSYQIIATNSPTSYSVTATGLALSVNGSGLVTGTLPTVTSPTDYSVTLNATNVSGTASQTFTLTVNPQAPIAAPAAMTVAVNASATLDLALSITGSVTSINIVSAAAHGTTIVSGTQVTYTPNHDYFGSDTFSYVAIGSGGSSAAAVVNVTIVGRPDPAKDARVIGLLDSQIATAQRFAKAQISNFQQRLEKLHRVSPAITASDLAALVAHDSNPSNNLAPGPRADNVGFATYKNNPWYFPNSRESITASGSPQLANLIVGVLTTSSINLAMLPDSDNTAPGALEQTEIWGAGNLRYGTHNQRSGGVIDFSTDGISIGADRRIDEALSLGMGMGYARDKSTIGTDGTGTASHARSVAAYGSYLLTPTLFMDGLIGYGKLNFDTTRYVQPINDFAYSQREGNQIFASLAAGYEYRTDGMLLSPYGRLDFATEHLYATTETGAGLYALNYASQTSHASQVSGGIRTELSHHADFGWILPHARIEYQRNTEEGQQASIAYADLLNGPRYEIASAIVNTNSVVLGIGSNFILRSGLKIGIDYQSLHSAGHEKNQVLNFRLSKELHN